MYVLFVAKCTLLKKLSWNPLIYFIRIFLDVLQVARNFARRKCSSNALAQLWNLESRAETRRARSSNGKSLLFQQNSLCPKERCKKSWVADLTNYCQSHSSHSAASFPSNCEMGTYIRRRALVDRHFPSETPSYWNIGELAILTVMIFRSFVYGSSRYEIFIDK